MFRSIAVSVAAAAIAVLAQSATAAAQSGASDVRQVVVPYGDLNIDKPHDAALLRERIAQAAIHACGGRPQFATHYREAGIFLSHDFEKCSAAAFDRAMSVVDAARARAADRRN